MKRVWLFLLIMCSLPLPVFAQKDNTAQVRLIHYGEGLTAVDVLVDDELVLRNLAYESVSRWLVIPVEASRLTIVPAGQGGTPLLQVDLALEADQWVSLLVIGKVADNTLTSRFILHSLTDLVPDFTRLTFFNAQTQPINIQANGTLAVENMGFGEAPWGTDEPAGTFPAQILSDENVLVDVATLQLFEAAVSYLIILRDVAGQVQVEIVPFDLRSPVYAAHFNPTITGAVDIYLNGEMILSNVGYASVSSPVFVPTGEYEVAVVPAGENINADTNTNQTTFQPATNAIIILSSNKTFVLEIHNYALLAENTDLSEGESAEIWIYHDIAGLGEVDITSSDGTTLLEGLNTDGEIGRLDVPAETYDLQIVGHEAPDTLLFDLPGLVLRGGNVYLLALIGTADGARTTHISAYCVRPEGC